MSKRQAGAEEFRKVGSGLILLGVIATTLHEHVAIHTSITVGLIGFGLSLLGVLVTPED